MAEFSEATVAQEIDALGRDTPTVGIWTLPTLASELNRPADEVLLGVRKLIRAGAWGDGRWLRGDEMPAITFWRKAAAFARDAELEFTEEAS